MGGAVSVGDSPDEVTAARYRREFFLGLREWVGSNFRTLVPVLARFGFFTDPDNAELLKQEVLLFMNVVAQNLFKSVVEARGKLEERRAQQHHARRTPPS